MEPLSMLLAGLASQALPDIYQWGKNQFFGPGPQDPNVQAQQGYLQQIQQPINMGMGQRRQQLMNEFNQQIMPQLQNQYAALGAGDTQNNLFGQAQSMAGANLATNLGALGEENEYRNQGLNQQRLAELRGYLGQQQGFGLQGNQQRQNFMLGMQGHNVNQMRTLSELVGALSRQGLAPQFETVNRPGQNAGVQDAAVGLLNSYLRSR